MEHLILAINPGSTSTKVALYKNEEVIFNESITHPHTELEKLDGVMAQTPLRMKTTMDLLEKHGYKPEDLSIVMGRGGILPPVEVGGYKVNDRMLQLIKEEKIPQHASNLGATIAYDIAQQAGVEAYVYDAVSAANFIPIAKITGMKEIKRVSLYHTLNCRAVAIHYAKSIGKKDSDVNLLIAHLGGGITIGAHRKGQIIDTLGDDNGPFAPERAGGVPLLDLIELCYSGEYSKKEMKAKIRGRGGLRDLLGTSDVREILKRIENGDKHAELIMEAQAYQIAKGIALLSPALRGDCDAIIITGSLAYSDYLMEEVKKFIGWLGKIVVLPGEFEMEALGLGGLRILLGEEETNEF